VSLSPDDLLHSLRRERDLLRGVFDASSCALTLVDLDGLVVDCNRATWEKLGSRSRDELVGRAVGEVVFDRLGFEETLAAVKADGVPRRLECTLQAGTGAQRIVDISFSLRRAPDGTPLGLVLAGNDISERKRTADALRVLNHLALEFAAAPETDELYATVAQKVRAALDARALAISSYDPAARQLTVRHVAIAGGILSAVQGVLGKSFVGVHLSVDEAMERRMLAEIVSRDMSITELSFGALSASVVSALGKLAGIGEVCGLALVHGGELFGSAMLVMPPCPFPPSREMLHVLANLTAVTLRRLR
jgi:PAS domain S-box-containing protein